MVLLGKSVRGISVSLQLETINHPKIYSTTLLTVFVSFMDPYLKKISLMRVPLVLHLHSSRDLLWKILGGLKKLVF
jgi:hypothetical protein